MILLNTNGKHNKFWIAEIDEKHNVIVKWGRLGTKGQSKVYPHYSQYAAQRFIEDKSYAKKRKEYKEVDDATFQVLRVRAELVGAGVKVDCCHFVKPIKPIEYEFYNKAKEFIIRPLENPAVEAADPDYDPMIYAHLLHTGGRGDVSVIITLDAVYSCTAKLGYPPPDKARTYSISDFEEINDKSPKVLQAVRDKADGIIRSMI